MAKIKRTTESFQKELDEKFPGQYLITGEYKGALEKLMVKHIPCDEETEMFPQSILRGSCSTCSGYKKKTTEQFKEEVKEQVGDEYSVLSDYSSAKKELTMKHNSCGKEFPTTPNRFLNNKARCPVCSRQKGHAKRARTHEQFVAEIESLVGDEYSIASEYKTNKTKVKFIHNKCNRPFGMRPGDFINSGYRCPLCNESKGEKAIEQFLLENNIGFERQYKFSDCKGSRRRLPFDFAIFNEDKELSCLIEYQGLQHFVATGYFNGQEKLDRQQETDCIKRDYCKSRNINLVEIPYTEFDSIEKILKSHLLGGNKHGIK